MKALFPFITCSSIVSLILSWSLQPRAAPRARLIAQSEPTRVPIPHRVSLGSLNSEELEYHLAHRQTNQQVPIQFCPEFFGQPPKPCSWCGGDTRIPGTCDQILVSGSQTNCPPLGPYDGCVGYYCQCVDGGTDNSPQVTSITVIDGATGTVVWEPMTLTEYASLRALTTVTLTEDATATSGGSEYETVVAAVFAGGIAWWVASQAGAAGAALAIQPPSQPPDGSKEDDPSCQTQPNEECQNCGGADSVALCQTGPEAGCPCDEVQHCPNQPPLCSDAICGGDNGNSQCSAQGEINGCLCCPDTTPECPESDCGGDTSGSCQSAQLKGCACFYVITIDHFAVQPDPTPPSQSDLTAIGAQIFTTIFNANYTSLPGYVPPSASASTDCSFVTTVYPLTPPPVLTGTVRYCTCSGDIIAGINMAVSGTFTTTFCAIVPAPSGFTRIPVSNGLPVTKTLTAAPPPTTTPAPPPPPPPPSSSASSTTTAKCNYGWCGAPFCSPQCGPG